MSAYGIAAQRSVGRPARRPGQRRARSGTAIRCQRSGRDLRISAPEATAVDPTQRHVGILGGGQLGRMMALAAANLGVEVSCLDPTQGAPAAVAAEQMVGSFLDAEAVEAFVRQEHIDVLTVEIEHVDVDALERAGEAVGVEVQPRPATLRMIQDKYRQKVVFREAGVAVPDFRDVAGQEDMDAAGRAFGFPFMLKRKRGAYDGNGNHVVGGPEDAGAAVATLGGFSAGLYAEKWVDYHCELAIMVTRSSDGSLASFPVVQTHHMDSILLAVEAPAQLPGCVLAAARTLAEKAVACLEGAGVFGIEMFALRDGSVLLNEVAPRPHNSGHYTMDACATSQFEQALRAILGLPLGSTAMLTPAAIMLNILGEGEGAEGAAAAASLREAALQMPQASLHWYNKRGVSARRKLGHVNITAGTHTRARQLLDTIAERTGLRGAVAAASAFPLQASLHTEVLAAAADRAGGVWGVPEGPPTVAIIMGSDSDLDAMSPAARVLRDFGVRCKVTIVSAHRTPERMVKFARTAHKQGIRVIIAGAGGAAHLPGMVASLTPLPVIGVPVKAPGFNLDGVDALLSMVQMPKGVPVATVAIGNATNAGLLAVRMLAMRKPALMNAMMDFQQEQARFVEAKAAKLEQEGVP